MEWIALIKLVGTIVGGILIAVISSWITWRRTNKARIKVSVDKRQTIANIPITQAEKHTIQITIKNTGNKLVRIEQCLFMIDGELKQIVVDRSRYNTTLRQDLPEKLDVAEKKYVNYPASAIKGKVTDVLIEDSLDRHTLHRKS